MSKLQPPSSANRPHRNSVARNQPQYTNTQLPPQSAVKVSNGPGVVLGGGTTNTNTLFGNINNPYNVKPPPPQNQSGRKKSASGVRGPPQTNVSTNSSWGYSNSSSLTPAAPSIVPQPPSAPKQNGKESTTGAPTVNKSGGAPRRYNFETLNLYVFYFFLLTIIRSEAKKEQKFDGFGSGVPETIQTARQPKAGKQDLSAGPIINKQPNSARPNYKPSEEKPTIVPQTARETPTPQREESPSQEPQVRFATPITPANALKIYDNCLSDFEQSEIFDYPKVHFLGNTGKKIRGSVSNTKNNHGYDDDRGDYKIIMNDHIAYRYEVLTVLGKGSFGQVCKCLDIKHNRMVALKIIRNKKRFHHQALVEVKILEHLKNNDPERACHVLEIYSYFYFRNHLCITCELMSINLYEFIMNNKFQGLSLGLIRRFAVQILASLKYLARERIIHCDLKPENILLRSPDKSAIKVIDFGSSCFEDERMYTYIQSRFYRSPEVILGIPYGRPIDMWSFGCILAELYTGYPLFPGQNEVEQLNYIMEVLDVPSKKIIDLSTRRKHFFDSNNNPRLLTNSRTGKKRRPGGKNLYSALRCNDTNFISFLEGCLRWDPHERFSPEEALRHEWILEGFIPSQPPSARGQYSSSGSRKPPPKEPTTTTSNTQVPSSGTSSSNSSYPTDKPPSASASNRISRNGNVQSTANQQQQQGSTVKRRYNVKGGGPAPPVNANATKASTSILPPLVDVKKKPTGNVTSSAVMSNDNMMVMMSNSSQSNTDSAGSDMDSDKVDDVAGDGY